MRDSVTTPLHSALKGYIRISPVEDPSYTFYERKNVIVQGVSYLFARLMANSAEPVAGVWGLAVGAGATSTTDGWSNTTQPDPLPTQNAMISEIKRKPLSQVQFLDTNENPVTGLTTLVSFQTVLNATTDNISTPIREMGLIGGGTTDPTKGGPTNMLTAPYFDPNNPTWNTVSLINYITSTPIILPAGIPFNFGWEIQF